MKLNNQTAIIFERKKESDRFAWASFLLFPFWNGGISLEIFFSTFHSVIGILLRYYISNSMKWSWWKAFPLASQAYLAVWKRIAFNYSKKNILLLLVFIKWIFGLCIMLLIVMRYYKMSLWNILILNCFY